MARNAKINKEDESPLNVLIGVWSGFAVTTVIMFWIFAGSWIKWIVIISVFAGAVKKTVTFVEAHKISQLESPPSRSSVPPPSSHSVASFDENTADSKYCPQCGTLLVAGLSQCSTCGSKL